MNNELIAKVFRYLGLGLLVTFIIAYFTSTNGALINLIYSTSGYIVICILQLICTLWLSFRINKMSSTSAMLLYIGYTALTGLTFSSIFIIFEMGSICFIFLATSIIFLLFSYIGKAMNIDLNKISIYLFIGLLSIIVLDLINIFLMNSTLDLISCILGIFIFIFYIAYDMQRLSRINANVENLAIIGAFNLYLDFINLFIRLLQLFGKERD